MRTTPRVASVRLIARDAELAALDAALTDAADGRPSLVLLAGESGVGKTRLLAEVERRAREAGARVLAGDCVDLGAGELPYLPLVAALRPLARREDPALTDDVRAAVAPLLPALSGRDDDVPAAGDAGQTRLFEGLLDAPGRPRPRAPGPARRRGRALERSVDARDARVPRAQPHA